MKKPRKISSIKADLWKLVSEFVRRSEANKEGYVVCVSCGRTLHWTSAHAGHFLSSRNSGILWDLRGIHPQCWSCNFMPDAMVGKTYYDFMVEKYGDEVIAELRKQKMCPPKLTREWYAEKIGVFKNMLAELI